MGTAIFSSELAIRFIAFASIFLGMAVLEMLAPRRDRTAGRISRWPSNLGIVALDTLFVLFVFPTSAVGIALLAETKRFGVFNIIPSPNWFAVVACVLALDLAIYIQHVLFHAVPLLWRVHRMHHTDLDFDVTTGLRFHPIETVVSMLIKYAAIAALGAPALAVLIFEVMLNATSMFNHGNVSLPPALDRSLRLFLVTPDMHRVHHSIIPEETNSNFGFNVPWWDRLFGTYRRGPAAGHKAMTIGIDGFRNRRELLLNHMLTVPFRGSAGIYPLGRKEARRTF